MKLIKYFYNKCAYKNGKWWKNAPYHIRIRITIGNANTKKWMDEGGSVIWIRQWVGTFPSKQEHVLSLQAPTTGWCRFQLVSWTHASSPTIYYADDGARKTRPDWNNLDIFRLGFQLIYDKISNQYLTIFNHNVES